jgi:iron complex outermembrane receptor protein
MRKLFLLMAAALILTCVKGFSQTLVFPGKTFHLRKLFSAVKSQTGYSFFYEADLLREAKPVTIDLKDVPLKEALNQILKDQPLGWLIEGKTITIIRKPLPLAMLEEANTPLIKLTGTIMDEDIFLSRAFP